MKIQEKNYSIMELEIILGSTGKQAIDRKLTRYGIKYRSKGRGSSRVYTILEISDPFKVFCIVDLGMNSRCKFDRMRYFFYYLLCAETLDNIPLSEMPAFLAKEAGVDISRQTLSKWLEKLNDSDFYQFSSENIKYYKITENAAGEKESILITRDEYKKAWQSYFNIKKATHDSGIAYSMMHRYLGGHPYKKRMLDPNAIYAKEIEELLDILNNWFLSQKLNK